jgi:probable rRNA maturation factor
MADGDSRAGAAKRARRTGIANRTRRSLDIDVLLPSGLRAPGLAPWLRSVAPARARGAVSVAVVSDVKVRILNREYRKKDQATDVLSFPAGDAGYLGDIVIAAGVARRQATAARHSLQTELRILALHGLLHLLGYDHEHDEGQMERLERRLRRKGGLRQGLIERAGGPVDVGVATHR